jgi:Protein of unknown function (DUF998)
MSTVPTQAPVYVEAGSPPSPVWIRVPAVMAPLSLVGGWLTAAQLQRSPAQASWATLSELAATYARHREVMTAAFAVTGGCLVVVALGLRSVADNGRLALAAAGVGVLIVSVAPLPKYAAVHSLAATAAFLALVLWPALGARPGAARTVDGRAATRATAVGGTLFVVLYAAPNLLGGFGIVERLIGGAGTVWMAVVAFDCSRRRRPECP